MPATGPASGVGILTSPSDLRERNDLRAFNELVQWIEIAGEPGQVMAWIAVDKVGQRRRGQRGSAEYPWLRRQ